ncbi:MAG: hypothetical protein AAFQ80_21760 [Cyanobacteria bacterium J06621_8]
MIIRSNPNDAEIGKGAPGDHFAVQMAQTTAVSSPDAMIPSNADRELNSKQIHEVENQEIASGMTTTDGYVIDESGRLDNFAVEPEMYVEEK